MAANYDLDSLSQINCEDNVSSMDPQSMTRVQKTTKKQLKERIKALRLRNRELEEVVNSMKPINNNNQ